MADPTLSTLTPIEGDLASVDLVRLPQALDACDFLLENLGPDAAFTVDERWGPEGELYLVEVAWSLLEAYRISGRQRYLDGGVAILNRLRIGMRLETDPTIIYGLKNYDGNIRKADIRRPHRWNTYVIYGLPPTPIAGAGIEAIDGVLNPTETKALYFVAKGGGAHHFSTTYAEHARMVRKYILKR